MEEFILEQGFQPQQTIEDTIGVALTEIITGMSPDNRIDNYKNIYARDTSRGKITLFDVQYWSRQGGMY
ncbi:MAG: hypothetical protein QXL17_01700 [Candidatus Thermoplasmatota archaeon]